VEAEGRVGSKRGFGSNSRAEELSASEKGGKDSKEEWIWATEKGYTDGEAGAIGEVHGVADDRGDISMEESAEVSIESHEQ
jgi:hypothetical protein